MNQRTGKRSVIEEKSPLNAKGERNKRDQQNSNKIGTRYLPLTYEKVAGRAQKAKRENKRPKKPHFEGLKGKWSP